MRLLILKAAASFVTVGATVASALFVTSHLKNSTAPLQPAVLTSSTSALGGTVTVGPSVHASDTQPVTSTYAS